MSEDDRRRWDRTYQGSGPAAPPAPPPLFASRAEAFPVDGEALDVACGTGQVSVWLARRGMRVLGVDISPTALGRARDLAARHGVTARCRFEEFDLDRGLPPGPPADLIVCHLYRDVRLYPALMARLAPGGLLAVAVLSGPGREPGAFRAVPGELEPEFAALSVLEVGEAEGRAWLLGRRPDPAVRPGWSAGSGRPADQGAPG